MNVEETVLNHMGCIREYIRDEENKDPSNPDALLEEAGEALTNLARSLVLHMDLEKRKKDGS